MIPNDQWIELSYNKSALLQVFFFHNHDEFFHLGGWYPSKLPLNLRTNPEQVYTQVSMTLKVSKDSTGKTKCNEEIRGMHISGRQ